jgi:hypothetical protein
MYGSIAVARALLLTKLIHNAALTSNASGRPLAKDERMLFTQLLT